VNAAPKLKSIRIRRQKPVRGGRERLSPCVLKEIRHAVERDAARYGVTASFVISVVLASHYRIDKQEGY
jgi:hypothetical protein